MSRPETDAEAEDRFKAMADELARLRRDLGAASLELVKLRAHSAALAWMVEYAPCESDEGACGGCVPCMAARVLGGDLAALDQYQDDPGVVVPCPHNWELDRICGAQVCLLCGKHKGLARCFCGWARSGGDGRRELLDAGEQIE